MFLELLGPMPDGVNSSLSPLLLQPSQMASAMNTTVRNGFVTQRSCLQKIAFDEDSQALLDAAFVGGKYQGGTYFSPDPGLGDAGLLISLAGRLFRIIPGAMALTATADEKTIAGDPNPPDRPQAWLWQSELWVIVNDGISNPIFYNVNDFDATTNPLGETSRRSNWSEPVPFTDTINGAPQISEIGANFDFTLTSGANVVVGDVLTIKNYGQVIVVADAASPTFTVNNVSALPKGTLITSGTVVTWNHLGEELPPGRMGTYGKGRNWESLTDGRQYVGSDQVGASSGTPEFNFRDAVLNVTENAYLAGGGFFIVPGDAGPITAMRFTATLDASLGQGPLQVFTRNQVFSVNTPVDRLTWQDVTNPIATQSLISNGAMGQESTVNVNGDLTFRSIDGIRSLVLARRDFDSYGNVPISREVQPLLDADNQTILNYGSAIVFDNRLLVTAEPASTDRGVVHTSIVPLNLDPLSSLRGKAPSVYDAVRWTGLRTFQMFVGLFEGRTRAFSLGYNATTSHIELYEILPTLNTQIADNDDTRIVWTFNSAALFKKDPHILKKLIDGEMWIDDLRGQVDIQVWLKPDSFPCWFPWIAFSVCQTQPPGGYLPGYRPRLGFGDPPVKFCDTTNNRLAKIGYTFEFRFIITGKCRFLGARFKAAQESESEFSKPECTSTCPTL